MPRKMFFGASRATSIDLCVRDLVSASRFSATTKIFAERCGEPFCDFNIDSFPHAKYAATAVRANHVAKVAHHYRPDVIIVQQHLPTAAAIAARLPHTKVILQTHNFQKDGRADTGLWGQIRRAFKRRRFGLLAGIVHVSEACAQHFTEAWPDVDVPGCVVNNGLDFDAWHPASVRSNEILCVGRCAPEKGIAEAALAVAAVLRRFPDWRARFILSETEVHPDYFLRVQAALKTLGAQCEIEVCRPFSAVKAAAERAAIALVPSKWLEPFGRTALEAHAGGAALISSGSGGLSEISRDTALMLSSVTSEAIATAVETLISDRALRERLARDGSARVRGLFDIRVQAARLDAFCEALGQGRVLGT